MFFLPFFAVIDPSWRFFGFIWDTLKRISDKFSSITYPFKHVAPCYRHGLFRTESSIAHDADTRQKTRNARKPVLVFVLVFLFFDGF